MGVSLGGTGDTVRADAILDCAATALCSRMTSAGDRTDAVEFSLSFFARLIAARSASRGSLGFCCCDVDMNCPRVGAPGAKEAVGFG